MKITRLTREQSKEQTRERLLSAAYKMFVTKGYLASSVEDIANVAGYTRGAFYSNFRSKTDVLLELLKRDHDEVESDLRAILEAGGPRDDMEMMLLAYYRQLYRRHDSFLLWMEGQLQAARDFRVRVHFEVFLRDRQERMTACIREFSERHGASLPLRAEVLALGLMGLCAGVQSYRVTTLNGANDELIDAVLAGFFSSTVFGRVPH